MLWSLGKKAFFPLVALSMVGIFSLVSFADEATKDKLATGNPVAGTHDDTPPGKIERAGQATGKGIEREAKATERGLKRGVKATERGLRRAGNATGKGIKKAGETVEKTFSGKD
jgi:hypothetical protein